MNQQENIVDFFGPECQMCPAWAKCGLTGDGRVWCLAKREARLFQPAATTSIVWLIGVPLVVVFVAVGLLALTAYVWPESRVARGWWILLGAVSWILCCFGRGGAEADVENIV
ncbi:hypothetical protein CRE_24505 [Caenorhabditis remanei]|uniref:Uncharacterized protein n=1 Tax=Caenorhabditis remanei TaxID=31234 RepID=E3MFZ3_CAERE|nr:hypothetical protein CRE_24505 [Caenorhabditis remanei]